MSQSEPSDQQILSHKKVSPRPSQQSLNNKDESNLLQASNVDPLSYEGKSSHTGDQSIVRNFKQHEESISRSIGGEGGVIGNTQKPFAVRLAKNKYLKATFAHFCSLSYVNNPKRTFDEMSKLNQEMSLNKFMIFCKEFNLQDILKYRPNGKTLFSKGPPGSGTSGPDLSNVSSVYRDNFSKTLTASQLQQYQKSRLKKEAASQSSPLQNDLTTSSASKVSQSKNLSKMVEIPVKEIDKVQKKIAALFKWVTNEHTIMYYEGFIKALIEIFDLYQRHYTYINKDRDEQFPESVQEYENLFRKKYLFVDNEQNHKEKMSNLKTQFKNSLSYYNSGATSSHALSSSPSITRSGSVGAMKSSAAKTKLVTHGGRLPNDVEEELKRYKGQKFLTRDDWVSGQSEQNSLYSKSRIYYKPNPLTKYETNDVVRLARNEMLDDSIRAVGGVRNHNKTLFDPLNNRGDMEMDKSRAVLIKKQKGAGKGAGQEIVTFSEVFEDKTNTFSEKLEELKKHYKSKECLFKLKKMEDNDDDILKMHFENEKRIYSHQKGGAMMNATAKSQHPKKTVQIC